MRSCTERLSAALALLPLLVSCDQSPPAPTPPKMVRIHLTCDVSGRIEPCGCFTGQFGGLTRVKTRLLSEGVPSLRVDAGDALAGTEDFHRIQYRHVLQAFGDLGFHALNVGRRESALSASDLSALARSSPVPLISANLLDAKSNAPLLRPWLQSKVDGVNFGIIGIVDPRSLREGGLGEGLQLADPEAAISSLLPEVSRGADVLVLLAFATEERMKELATRFYEFQVILGGDVTQPSQELIHANRSLIFATTNQGRALGRFEARLDGQKLVDPKQSIVLMADDIPQDESIQDFARAYRAEVRKAKLDLDDPSHRRPDEVPGVRASASYVGSALCAGCHQQDFAAWQKSAHASAFAALLRRESDADPNCIGCHSIGFGTPGGYRREFAGSKLVDVGCESCHGPGSAHVKQRTSGKEVTEHFRPLGAGDCLRCHVGEFSRPFEWEKFWPPVAHGKKLPVAASPKPLSP